MSVKRGFSLGILIVLTCSLTPSQVDAAQKITPGSTCKTLKQKIVYLNKTYTCTKSGKKIVWSKGVKVASTPTLNNSGLKTIHSGSEVPTLSNFNGVNPKVNGYIGGVTVPIGFYYTSDLCTVWERFVKGNALGFSNQLNTSMIIEVTPGMELLNSCTLHPGVPPLQELPREGMNVVGTTLPPGNYVLSANGSCRYYLGNVAEMITQKYKKISYENHKIITLKNGQAFWIQGCGTIYKTFDQTPDLPAIFMFRPIYLTDSDSTTDRTAAIRHDVSVIKKWFSDQIPGRELRFVDLSNITIIRDTKINRSDSTENRSIVDTWRKTGVIGQFDVPIVYAESTGGPGCAWESELEYGYIWLPMDYCKIYPSETAQYPYGATYVVSHEITHALGAAEHFSDNNRDVLYNGTGDRDWLNIVLDPGHIHYFRTGDPSKPDIEKSPLLTQVP